MGAVGPALGSEGRVVTPSADRKREPGDRFRDSNDYDEDKKEVTPGI